LSDSNEGEAVVLQSLPERYGSVAAVAATTTTTAATSAAAVGAVYWPAGFGPEGNGCFFFFLCTFYFDLGFDFAILTVYVYGRDGYIFLFFDFDFDFLFFDDCVFFAPDTHIHIRSESESYSASESDSESEL